MNEKAKGTHQELDSFSNRENRYPGKEYGLFRRRRWENKQHFEGMEPGPFIGEGGY